MGTKPADKSHITKVRGDYSKSYFKLICMIINVVLHPITDPFTMFCLLLSIFTYFFHCNELLRDLLKYN